MERIKKLVCSRNYEDIERRGKNNIKQTNKQTNKKKQETNVGNVVC